jgi:hypothetical protein
VGAAGDEVRHGGRCGVAQRGMEAPPRGGFGRVDGTVSRDERSEELGISVGCRGVDGVDRGENVVGPVGPVAVLERARSRTSDFFKDFGRMFCSIIDSNI